MKKSNLINRFPRELARPFKDKIAYNMDDVMNYVRRYGSSYGIHISVYPFSTITNNKVDYESAIIDKIYVDIDDIDWLEQLRSLFSYYVYDNDIISIYSMSGKGCHCYSFCEETIKNKRNCVFNFQSYLEKELGIIIDPQVKGDLSRTFRMPNTFNFKRGRYCIVMDEDLIFNKDEREIYAIAKQGVYKPSQRWYGNNLVDLSDFDTEDRMYGIHQINVTYVDNLMSKKQLERLDIFYDKFPPCVRWWLNNPRLSHHGRNQLTIYLRDQLVTDIPIPFRVIVSLFKCFLDEDIWLHMSTNMRLPNHHEGEGLRPVKTCYSRLDYKLYSCRQLRDLGLCPERCGRWHPIYEN